MHIKLVSRGVKGTGSIEVSRGRGVKGTVLLSPFHVIGNLHDFMSIYK